MINAVGRDIPEEILEMTGKEVFQEIITGTDMYTKRTAHIQSVWSTTQASWLQTSMMCW